MRVDILIIFENEDLPDNHVKALLKLKYSLAKYHDKWLKADCSHIEMLEDTIEDFGEYLAAATVQKKKSVSERLFDFMLEKIMKIR